MHLLIKKTEQVKTTKILLFTILFSCLLFSCEEKKSNGTKDSLSTNDTLTDQNGDSSVIKSSTPVKFDPKFDQVTRVISGVKQDKGSTLASIDTSTSWKSFSASFDSSWALIESKRFSKMTEWRTTELADVNSSSTNVFYPFSGPDVLNAFILFPKAKTYTLMALEPIGELPDFNKMNEKQKQEYYLSIEVSLNDLLKKSYFITKNMLNDLQKHKVNGTLPLMCLFLKRTGNTIIDIKNIGIDTTGKTFERSDTMKYKGSRGVRIDFLAKGSNEIRSVYYFKCDLGDEGIKANKGLARYLQNMGTVHTYLKSASYLLHYKEFNTVRNTIFEKSDCIVQDDSGIAFRFFDQTKWKIQLYGKYAKPVVDFPHIKEPDLQMAYEKDSTIKALPFELGYHWGTRANNMLKATRLTK
jgi:hypothetical protein